VLLRFTAPLGTLKSVWPCLRGSVHRGAASVHAGPMALRVALPRRAMATGLMQELPSLNPMDTGSECEASSMGPERW